jgi:hypothetical protein
MMKKFLFVTVLSMLPCSGAMAMEPGADDPVPPPRRVQFKLENPEKLVNSGKEIWAIFIGSRNFREGGITLFHDFPQAELTLQAPYQVQAWCETGNDKIHINTLQFKTQAPPIQTADPDKINILQINTFKPEDMRQGDCELEWLEPQPLERR